MKPVEGLLIYDGSFDGMVSAIRMAWLEGIKPDNIVSYRDYVPSLYEKKIEVATANEKDLEEFVSLVSSRLTEYSLKCLIWCYLSETKGAESLVCEYLMRGLQKGKSALTNAADPLVQRVENICHSVRRECHRFYGLLRFSVTDAGIYYAPFEPDHNIISLIAPHFSVRLGDQDWIIHDKKRDIAVFHSAATKEVIHDDVLDKDILFSVEEEMVRKMWQCYFKSISIQERLNPNLQRRFMPVRYWKYLTEKS